MANRFPLIVNTASGNSVQELPSGDFLDLSNSGIANSGNITVNASSYFVGNGSLLTGVVSSFGNANVVANVAALGSNPVTTTANITGGNILTGGLISATGNITGGNILGGANVNATTHTGTTASLTGNITGGNILTAGLISATGAVTGAGITGTSLTVTTGNITGGNLIISGAIVDSAQLDIQTSAANANIVLTPNGTGNVNISGNIMPTANATANIGSATLSFNTVFAKSTSAQYADLAEKYTADAEYAPGTVVAFGGNAEVTLANEAGSTRIAGVISTNPSYIMNATLEAQHVALVALQGRVPCRIIGPVRKGDMMVSAGNGAACVDNAARAGSIIGKALEDFDGVDGTIEVVVGRF